MRLARGISPRQHESLVGFVLRAAEVNRLSSAAVYQLVMGRVVCPTRRIDAAQLADVCGCTVPEVMDLFGVWHRHENGTSCLRLGDQWVTQERFVSSRKMAVCVECLRNNVFLPAVWELTFYRACAYHRRQLLSSCPSCRRRLSWMRPRIALCGCGYDFRNAGVTEATDSNWMVAQLIERRIDSSFALHVPNTVPRLVLDRLAALTLDGLFKTLWFLGYRLARFDACRAGYGRGKLSNAETDAVVNMAFAMLADWPSSLGEIFARMETCALSGATTRLYRRAFKPIVAYLDRELPESELVFVRLHCERAIRQLWSNRNRQNTPRDIGSQLELNFDDKSL